jgi:hypothetical protein
MIQGPPKPDQPTLATPATPEAPSASRRETPKFTVVDTYRDPLGRYSIRFPGDWNTFLIKGERSTRYDAERQRKWSLGKRAAASRAKRTEKILATAASATEEHPLPAREGFGFSPVGADPQTVFSVWVAPLAEAVVAEDFAELREGVDNGLAALEDCHVELAQDDTLSNLVKFERVYTYREGGEVRKRRQWLLYVDTWLMCVTWQASSPEEYQYWYAMVNHSFISFDLPEQLWFATDRDLSGIRRAERDELDEVEAAPSDAGSPGGTRQSASGGTLQDT